MAVASEKKKAVTAREGALAARESAMLTLGQKRSREADYSDDGMDDSDSVDLSDSEPDQQQQQQRKKR